MITFGADPAVSWSDARRVGSFFLLVLLLSFTAAFAFGGLDWRPVPGVPATAILSVLCPLVAGGVLVAREGGMAALRAYLFRGLSLKRFATSPWVLFVILIHPILLVAHHAILQQIGANPPPLVIDPAQAFLLLLIFLLPAWGEEMGWTGYATDPLRRLVGPVSAGLILGVAQALWHVWPLLLVGRTIDWIAWWALGAVVSRVVFVWVYERGGRNVVAAVLLHAMSNVSWQLFPVSGSHYDPRVGSLLMAALALCAAADLKRSKC